MSDPVERVRACLDGLEGASSRERDEALSLLKGWVEMNWASAQVIAHVDNIILSKGYDCASELIPGDTMPTATSLVEKGEPSIAPELWSQNIKNILDPAEKEGKIKNVGKVFENGGEEGLWIPTYMVKKNPKLATIEGVLQHPELFPHPEDSSKGGIIICPEGWSCKKHNENLFRAFDMEAKGWKIIDPGSGTGLNAYWEGAVVKGQAAFGYYWTPTVLVGRLGLVSLQSELGFTGDDNWTNCISIAVEECENPQPTSFPVAKTGTIITLGLDSAVVDYVTARGFDGSVITSMLVWSDDNQATAEEAAVEFITRHPEIWTKWVTPEAATRITASLN